jgi:hypothetical protein
LGSFPEACEKICWSIRACVSRRDTPKSQRESIIQHGVGSKSFSMEIRFIDLNLKAVEFHPHTMGQY